MENHSENNCCSSGQPSQKESYYMALKDIQTGLVYTCPMHPEIQQLGPGSCPKCGMALEPSDAFASNDEQHELKDMSKRFWFTAILSIPLLLINMGMHFSPVGWLQHLATSPYFNWFQALLATPVVLWGGWPFWQKAWASIKSGYLNMFTLIGLGVGVAYLYSLTVLVVPYFTSYLLMSDAAAVYFEPAAVITTLVLLGQVLELRARSQTSQAVQQLLELTPPTARIIMPDGTEQEIELSHIKVGHLLRIRPGDKIPVDAAVVEGTSTINQAMITGESIPVEKSVSDKVMAGTLNMNGSLIIRAERVGHETVLAQVVAMVTKAQRTKAPIQRLADKVSGYFVPIVIGISLVTAVIWYIWGPEPKMAYALVASIAVLIIACPCALGLATPMSIMVGTGRGAREGILIKDATALETLAKIDTLVIDKTGTLTVGKPQVARIINVSAQDPETILLYAATLEKGSEHPLAAAIVEDAQKKGLTLKEIQEFMSITGRGVQGKIDNAFVAVGNEAFMYSLGINLPEATNIDQYRKAGQGVVFVSINYEFCGLIIVSDVIKESTKPVIKKLQEQGVEVIMLTGDNEITAKAIAQELGISKIKADVLPTEKYDYVRLLQDQGKIVAMVGDGVNDAPALAQANIGVAMGTGADIAIESAGLTLMSGNLDGITKAHQLSLVTLRNIKQNLFLAFGYNALAIPIAAGLLYPMFGMLLSPVIASVAMALSSVSVILNAARLTKVKI
ncbi:copper-transporting P-type ATPase [Candidatus Odyssella thessalonicensis]|uniref:copper-transporting P-type ATPase n=1 Tax=Candidatus Odyssella thessalonicensis TaxID=84647 RepID=UPI000225AA16|nr:copper-translocating P-type ATPase [Candidatus Odyssella thessalonicensis]